jgi:Holliday junction resolvase
MSLHRQNARRDGTERRIIQALRKVGVQVFPMSGRGLPDLLLFHRGRWSVLEIKTKGGRLTDAQKNTRVTAPFPIASTVEEALALFQVGA